MLKEIFTKLIFIKLSSSNSLSVIFTGCLRKINFLYYVNKYITSNLLTPYFVSQKSFLVPESCKIFSFFQLLQFCKIQIPSISYTLVHQFRYFQIFNLCKIIPFNWRYWSAVRYKSTSRLLWIMFVFLEGSTISHKSSDISSKTGLHYWVIWTS